MDYLFLQIYLLCKLTLRSSCDIALYSGLHTMTMSEIWKNSHDKYMYDFIIIYKIKPSTLNVDPKLHSSALNWGQPNRDQTKY